MTTTAHHHDIVLFGVTGFTGKLAAEYLMMKKKKRRKNSDFTWAACARNESKAETALREIVDRLNRENDEEDGGAYEVPPILVANTIVEEGSEDEEATLSDIVQNCSVVLTCIGPYELYGKSLVRLCARYGTDYADITGETDFVRQVIVEHDESARKSNARIVPHCGNDCVPQDLMVYEMNEYVKKNNWYLSKVRTCVEFSESSTWSGGTVATATYQLSKNRKSVDQPPFDPLLTDEKGQKSEYVTKNVSPKSATSNDPDFCDGPIEPWIMGPVMVNCVRRSK